MRRIFPKTVYEIMKENKNVFCLLGDIGIFSFKKVFSKFKNRILNMSTMEQSMIGFGAGLSKAGYIPIIHSITPFLILRALEQIKIDFVYNKLACNIITTGASNDYSKLGATHHCFEDISVMSNYNNINIFIPSSVAEFEFLLKKNYNNNSVNYFRISENTHKKILKKNCFIKSNKASKLVIVVGNAIDVDSIKIKNMDVYYINSITRKLNLKFIKNYKKIIIVEPYFGNILERKIREKKYLDNKILTLSYDETIIYKYGKKEEQDKYLNFDKKSILKKIYEFN